MRQIAEEVWGDLNGSTSTERSYGKGRVFWGLPLATVLEKLDIQPDCDVTSRSGDAPINFIHRRVGDAEVYFVANRRRHAEDVVCTFRVKGKQPELWNPETGEITPLNIYDQAEAGIRVPLQLGPAESVFVVFRSPAAGAASPRHRQGRQAACRDRALPRLSSRAPARRDQRFHPQRLDQARPGCLSCRRRAAKAMKCPFEAS